MCSENKESYVCTSCSATYDSACTEKKCSYVVAASLPAGKCPDGVEEIEQIRTGQCIDCELRRDAKDKREAMFSLWRKRDEEKK